MRKAQQYTNYCNCKSFCLYLWYRKLYIDYYALLLVLQWLYWHLQTLCLCCYMHLCSHHNISDTSYWSSSQNIYIVLCHHEALIKGLWLLPLLSAYVECKVCGRLWYNCCEEWATVNKNGVTRNEMNNSEQKWSGQQQTKVNHHNANKLGWSILHTDDKINKNNNTTTVMLQQ